VGILLVAATVATATVYEHLHTRSAKPRPTPSPAATALFMFRQPAPIIDFYTWDGRLVRRLMTSLPVVPTADGRLFVDSTGRIYETQGQQAGLIANWAQLSYPSWADDGAHICGTTKDTDGMDLLEVVGIHGDVRRYPLETIGQYPVASACSLKSGRAAIQSTGGIRVLSLRDGKTLRTVALDADRPYYILSRDARWLARQLTLPTGHLLTEVVDLTDGNTAARYDDLEPGGFTPDAKLLVVGVFPNNKETRVLDWRTGQVVWSRTTDLGLAQVAAVSDVATGKVLVELHTNDPNSFHYVEYWMVDGQGTARQFHPVP
jgi:hypothetical protein